MAKDAVWDSSSGCTDPYGPLPLLHLFCIFSKSLGERLISYLGLPQHDFLGHHSSTPFLSSVYTPPETWALYHVHYVMVFENLIWVITKWAHGRTFESTVYILVFTAYWYNKFVLVKTLYDVATCNALGEFSVQLRQGAFGILSPNDDHPPYLSVRRP
jgi:hypothetical protein